MESLTHAELLALLAAARRSRQRDWLMILVAYNHALRASEVVGFTRDAVQDGYLTIDRLKGSLKTTQRLATSWEPLLDERDALTQLALNSRAGQPLFNISRQHFWRLIQQYGEAAGIPKHRRHPHILKHTILSEMVAAAGVPAAQRRGGHKSGKSTLEYTKFTDQEADDAFDSLNL